MMNISITTSLFQHRISVKMFRLSNEQGNKFYSTKFPSFRLNDYVSCLKHSNSKSGMITWFLQILPCMMLFYYQYQLKNGKIFQGKPLCVDQVNASQNLLAFTNWRSQGNTTFLRHYQSVYMEMFLTDFQYTVFFIYDKNQQLQNLYEYKLDCFCFINNSEAIYINVNF